MDKGIRKITIIKVRKPQKQDLNDELQWFSHSLGLFNLRDREKSTFRIFIELLKAVKTNTSLTSDEIAERSNLTRATVVHHLAKLIEQGIVTAHKRRYYLRDASLQELVKELRKDMDRMFEDLEEQAKLIDNEMGFED